METLTQPSELSASPPASTTSCPRWVMLHHRYGEHRDSTTADDGDTAVVCRTSTGWLIRFSFVFAAPPASSLLCYDWAGRAPREDDYFEPPRFVAAHGDSILLEMWAPLKRPRGSSSVPIDHILYQTGAAGGGPPSASLLPACYFPMQYESRRNNARRMRTEDTGILRRGEDDLLVAQLEVTYDEPYDTAELCVLRPGGEWELRRAVPIVFNDDDGSNGNELIRWRDTDAIVPIGDRSGGSRISTMGIVPHAPTVDPPLGDRFLCWINYFCGFLLWDTTEEVSPKLRHVPLPVSPPERTRYTHGYDRPCMRRSWNMGAAGPCALRFVSIAPRCCCGGPGESTCARSRFAFTVTTWTMALHADKPMTWVKDGVLDCDELWSLPAYQGLARVRLEYPVVSLDNPDVVCFMVCEDYSVSRKDQKMWMVEVDTRRKALLSVVRCTIDRWSAGHHLPAKLQWVNAVTGPIVKDLPEH
ncbi:hypothetical protein ACP70R_003911 [Stipagrostis hirtigluma subsp. patula]